MPTSQVQWNDEIEEQEIRKLIEKQELLEKKKKEAEELLNKEKLLKQVSNIHPIKFITDTLLRT